MFLNNMYESLYCRSKRKNYTRVIELRIKHFKLMLWKKDDAVVYIRIENAKIIEIRCENMSCAVL